jgi:hypothetical chaperone protein
VSRGGQVSLLPLDTFSPSPEVVKTLLYITKDFQVFIGQQAVELYYRQNVNRRRNFVRKWAGELDFYGGEMFYVQDSYVYVDELKPGRMLQYLKTALRSDGYEGTQIFDRYYSLVDLIAIYLRELKQRAEAILGEEIHAAMLGRPVKFSPFEDLDRAAEDRLRQAAEEAGFRRVAFELEPVAAALDYERTLTRPQNALIFDFGGGTLDLTIMRLGDPHNRKVYANGGIGIAGSDFDRTVIQTRMLPHFGKGAGDFSPEIQELIQAIPDWISLPDLSTPKAKSSMEKEIRTWKATVQLKALEGLIFNDLSFSFYNAVEAAKIALSNQGAAVIALQDKDLDIWELYTRYQFEQDILAQRKQIEAVLLDTLVASGLEPEQIDVVVKTGGSSNIPVFSEMLRRVFGPEKLVASDVFNSVTAGLAIRAEETS